MRTPPAGTVRQALSSAFGRASNSFKQWGRTQPGSAASRRLVGSWGARLAGASPGASKRLKGFARFLAGPTTTDKTTGVTERFEVPALISITLGKSPSGGWRVDTVDVLGKTTFERKTPTSSAGGGGASNPAAPAPSSPAPSGPTVKPPTSPAAAAASAKPKPPPKPLPKPPIAKSPPPAAAP